jgi:hypothetical protein
LSPDNNAATDTSVGRHGLEDPFRGQPLSVAPVGAGVASLRGLDNIKTYIVAPVGAG